jgi:DNA polymerase III sliding clamp (beta) subunit (PCNA family)
MRFIANVQSLLNGLFPVVTVASKGAVKEFDFSMQVTLNAGDNELQAFSHGGRLALTISMDNLQDPNLDYQCEQSGKSTVNAVDFYNCINSFPSERNIIVALKDNELIITDSLDTDQFQTLPTMTEEVLVPERSSSFDKELTIDRNVFIEGAGRTNYAAGALESRYHYMYWMLDIKKNWARFTAGQGGRFAIFEVSGENFLKTDSEVKFYFPEKQTKVFISLLKEMDDDYITIKQASSSDESPDQILLTCGTFEIMLVGFDPDIYWPDIEAFLKKDRIYSVITEAQAWDYATRGVMATYNEEVKKQHDTHQSVIEVDLEGNQLILRAAKSMRSERKVPIIRIEKSDGDKKSLSLSCSTQYLREIFTKSDKADEVTIEFIDEKDPVTVTLPEKINEALGISERFVAFFAAMNS